MSDDRRVLGTEGETRAAAYLEERGYRIRDRNIRCGGVEIDLIASRGRLVVFVEVKTRRSRRYGLPEEAVDARKRTRIVRGARHWLFDQPQRFARVRFDVICCDVTPGPDAGTPHWQLRHIEAAFDAGD